MKKKVLTLAVALTLVLGLMLSSCIGSFALTNKVHNWNKQVGSKFVNELVFVAFHVLPVYPISVLADILVLNSIEFWSGNNPVEVAQTKVIDGKDAKYLVEQDATGYTITNQSDNSVTRFNFDAADNSWSVDKDGMEVKFMQFIDDSHVKMLTPSGAYTTVELNEQGVFAFEQLVNSTAFFAAR